MIGAEETVRVRYRHNQPEVESERRARPSRKQEAYAKNATTARAGKRLSNAKREERQRRQKGIRFRRVGLLAGIAAAVVLLIWGVVSLYRSPIFTIKNIEVTGGRHYDRPALLRLAKVPRGSTLIRVSPSSIERRLESDPWIAEARVDRDYPGTLKIEVSERAPRAIVDAGGTSLWVVSSDGYWLGKRGAADKARVTIRDVGEISPKAGKRVKEANVLNAVHVIEQISSVLLKRVKTVSAPSVDETALLTTDNIEIFVGEAVNMREKDRIVREILRRQKGVVYINVRTTTRPTWRGLGSESE